MPDTSPLFNPLRYPLALAQPQWITDASAWVAHIPFAMASIEMLRPRSFVELGTLKGDSYCAFCQAVAALALDCECFAIDTWRGDPHAPISQGEQILQELRSHHDPRYGTFSTLVPSDFDAAALRFEEGSIDLLHIDGYHTYDAVRHDYETWRPKLTDRAVVFFHDTQVRYGDFGLWKFWAEVSGTGPSFEFEHAYGLGVLAVGPNVPREFLDFLAAASATPDLIRQFFFSLGHRIELMKMANIVLQGVIWAHQRLAEWRRQRGHDTAPLPDPIIDPAAFTNRFVKDFVDIIQSGQAPRT